MNNTTTNPTSGTVLVTGATGTIGSRLVPMLTARGVPTRALVRDPDRAKDILPSVADLIVGDFADDSSVAAALDGVEAVFLACGNVAEQVEHERSVIDLAAAAGVRRIVKLSARGAELGSPVVFWHWHALIEQHLSASGVPATVLRPSFLMSNLFAAAETVRTTGTLFAPAADAQITMVDPADVAAVAATALVGDHEERTYTLTGPAPVTFEAAAEALSHALNRTIAFQDVPADAARSAMEADGLPPFAAQQLAEVFTALRRGDQSLTTDDLNGFLGRVGRPLARFLAENARAFGA